MDRISSLETEQDAENYLWSLCEGYSGDGWTKWDNTETSRQLQDIRFLLKVHVDSDLYGRHCNAQCRGRDNFGRPCSQQVSVSEKHCHIHR